MNVALKEWACVSAAISSGRQIVLLRKGGIVEADRGGFKPKHREFLLFPTFEHQHARFLKDGGANIAPETEDSILIETLCKVSDVLEAPADPAGLIRASEFYIWNEDFIRARYDYRPELPLTLLLVRAYRLAAPQMIRNRPSYAGCKSWVNLTEEIDPAGAEPVLTDAEYARRQSEVTLCASL
jgi:hypothetical protein